MPDRGFVIFYEMNMLVGDMFDAFLETRNRLNCPTFFATACGSESHACWWECNKRKLLKAKHLAGELQVAGFPVLPKDVPEDLLEQSPRLPQLRKMEIRFGGHLCVPDELKMKWGNDPTSGSRFRAFLDEFSEEPCCASLSVRSDRLRDVICSNNTTRLVARVITPTPRSSPARRRRRRIQGMTHLLRVIPPLASPVKGNGDGWICRRLINR